jgi:hypothetical protein
MSVESRLAQRNRTETEKLLAQEKAEAGLKSMAIGPITGTLGLPSDILDLADMANDAIAMYGKGTVTGQFSKLIKPTLDKVQEKYGREAFDRGFTELTGIKSDSTNPAQILGELVSLGGLAKTGVKGAKIVGNTMSDTYQGAKKLFQDASGGTGGGSLQAVNNAPINSVDETSKLVDKTKVDAPINTDIPTLKAEDLANKPIVNPSMIGAETELGQKQIGLYEKLIKDSKALGGKAPTQERLFERTGVYKGSDGKYRFDLDDRDAAFNTTFLENALVKNPNLKNPPTLLSGSIVSYSGLNPKLFNLREVLDFDSLYKQYGKTLKVGDKAYSNIGNLKVKFTSKTNGVRGSYSGDTDTITLNITDKDGFRIKDLGQIESTLLHEVQHAIQRREGFNYGSNMDNFLRSGYTQDYKTNAALQDNILARLSNDLEDGLTYLTDSRKLGFLSDLEVKSKRINRIENMPSADKTDAIKKEYMDLTASRADDVARIDLPQAQKKKIFNNFNKAMDKNARQRKLLDREESIAYEKYRDVYGEREARLVQERYKKRKSFKGMSGGLDFGEDKISSIMSKDTSFLENMTNKKAQGGLQLAKGGNIMNMNRQMELFQGGGLKDEGGTIDPVSGNNVPSGSTQEEVRDNVPAQLSEGEFIFPADVTRYWGLDTLMKMRQKAKMGLQKMEAMGQMGNSDEATIPDDLPFNIEDLDIEDDDTVEMYRGGVVKAATGVFINPGTGVTSMPSQFAGQNLPSYNANQTYQTAPSQPYNVPVIPQGGYSPNFVGDATPTGAPSFETLVGKNPGQYDELREYRNDAGGSLRIPFKNGQPIYPIPEGYLFVDPEEVETIAPTLQSVKPKTTQVSGGDGNDSDPEMDAGLGGGRTSIGGVSYAVGYDMQGNVTVANVNDAVKSGRASFSRASPELAGLISQQTKGQIGMVTPGMAAKSKQSAIAATTALNNYTGAITHTQAAMNAVNKSLAEAKARSQPAQVSKAQVTSAKAQTAIDAALSSLGQAKSRSQADIDMQADIAGAGAGKSQAGTQEMGYDYGDDVATDSKGHTSNEGPNAHGFDAYGTGVADRQGTATGVASNGAISYSPDHDWSQPTQTSVDTDKGYSTSSTGTATTTSADERGTGLGSIDTNNDGGNADSCFTKGTKVKLYKGGTIAIERLKKGDVVLGIYGEPNEVLGMDIHKVTNDNRPELVQMEGYKKPFITANHPFYKFAPVKNSIYGKNQNFGTGVLMSFNNKQNDQYHPWLGKVENAKEYFKYKKVLAKEGEMLYNLYLDGDHTHYANELPVHNIVRNGHISFALLYKNYITKSVYDKDVEYVQGFKNKYIRLGYAKIAYPLAYEIMNDTLLGKITAKIATPFVKAFAKAQQKQKASNLVKIFGYTFVYPTFYLRGLIGR